jgi:hypothetical protein
MIRINQADRLSIAIDMFPNTADGTITIFIGFPASALIAGIEVTAATNNTKIKLAFALMEFGRNAIKIIPVTGNNNAKKNNNRSMIDIIIIT